MQDRIKDKSLLANCESFNSGCDDGNVISTERKGNESCKSLDQSEYWGFYFFSLRNDNERESNVA